MSVTIIGYTGIRIRGTDGTRINVTLNGIPYNDAESSMTYFVDLPEPDGPTKKIISPFCTSTNRNKSIIKGYKIWLSRTKY